ncbi:LacI family transcriptional regulator [Streptomyces sp. SLBN-118]|uniref:LacI family DNA-binding transcriptional regulator n=1 Tax=Streptomyces sp. SLBN-118 TaxID=2768454 RepID=UPI0011734BA8|nr:LacI family DNA-binding transcriptional regulator [Streptomyces sp. SLBN-118]TQK50170.1 LacI family transcriptional regulator [Streptomyces sp. SLBN-118]
MTIESERRPTLARIAELAGVSVPTVSKVLNGYRDVSVRTQERVERIIAQEGYVRPSKPRDGAGALLDLVINDLDSAWAAEILTGAEEVAREHRMHLVLRAVHTDAPPALGWLEALGARGSRGVILVLSDLTAVQRRELRRMSIPFVVVDAVGGADPPANSVTVTNRHGGFSAAQHLISLGHSRIAVIGGPEHLSCTRERVAGYRDALKVAGLRCDPRLIRYGPFRHEEGYRQACALLELPTPPTGIVAGNDVQALGAYQALKEHRLRVPSDVSVVGFDDVHFTPWTSPPLTSVRQPLRDMGALATRMLVTLVNGGQPPVARIELATNLVVRESTGPVAASRSR